MNINGVKKLLLDKTCENCHYFSETCLYHKKIKNTLWHCDKWQDMYKSLKMNEIYDLMKEELIGLNTAN
jgi:hypothetical protein